MGESEMSTFNRSRPLLERKNVPCEVITIESKKNGATGSNIISKRKEYFTLRILEGYRRNANKEETSLWFRYQLYYYHLQINKKNSGLITKNYCANIFHLNFISEIVVFMYITFF